MNNKNREQRLDIKGEKMTKILYVVFKKIIDRCEKDNVKVWEIGEFLVFNLNKDLMVFVSFPISAYDSICHSVLFELKSRKKGILDRFYVNFFNLFESALLPAALLSVSDPASPFYPLCKITEFYEKVLSNKKVDPLQNQSSYINPAINNQQKVFSFKHIIKNNDGTYTWSSKLTELEQQILVKELETYIDIWS